MKRWVCLVLAGMLLVCCTACGGEAGVPAAYEARLEELRQGDTDSMQYFYRDLEGDGTPELCVTNGEGMTLTVYTLRDGELTLVGTERFGTGTLRLLASDKAAYPGLFLFSVGGGRNWYRYLTIREGELVIDPLWEDVYSEGTVEEHTDDRAIIAESEAVYHGYRDVERSSFTRLSVPEQRFDTAEAAYGAVLDALRREMPAETLQTFWRYLYADIDGDGGEELCVLAMDNHLQVFSFRKDGRVKLRMEKTLVVGDCTWRLSEEHPGLFVRFGGGGGCTYYGHFGVEKDRLIFRQLWEHHVNGYGKPPQSVDSCQEQTLIAASKVLYEQDAAPEWLSFSDQVAYLDTAPNQSAAYNETIAAYNKFLNGEIPLKTEQGDYLVTQLGTTGQGIASYALGDVTGDGVPELFIHEDYYGVLSFDGTHMVEWYTSMSWQRLYLLKNGDVLDCHTSVGITHNHVSFDAVGTTKQVSFTEPLEGDPTPAYFFEGDEVTKQEWDTLTKPYFAAMENPVELAWRHWEPDSWYYPPSVSKDTG